MLTCAFICDFLIHIFISLSNSILIEDKVLSRSMWKLVLAIDSKCYVFVSNKNCSDLLSH